MIDAIFPIVEGHGEVRAVPILLRRLAQKYGAYTTQIFRPYRVPRGRMFAGSHLENAVELACRKLEQVTGIGAVLVLLDADSDCPAEIAPDLLRRVRGVRPGIRASVVVANCEYEAWFLAAARSLRGVFVDEAEPPDDPEVIRDAKGFLRQNLMSPDSRYSVTVDQPRLTARMDLDEARTSPSFDKLCRDLDGLFGP